MCASRLPAVGSSDWLDARRRRALRSRNSGLVITVSNIPKPTPPISEGIRDSHECCQHVKGLKKQTSLRTLHASARRLAANQTDRSQQEAWRNLRVKGAKSIAVANIPPSAHRTASYTSLNIGSNDTKLSHRERGRA